jgi:hypothetical protein
MSNLSDLFASSTATSNSRGSISMLQSAVLFSLPYQDTDAWDKKACSLVDFYNDHKIVPLPIPKDNKLLLVLKAGNKAKNAYGWLNFLVSIGVDIYYAVETGKGDKTKLVGKVFDFRGSDGYVNVKGHKSEVKTQFAAYDESIAIATKVYTHEMHDVVMGYFASWFTTLDATKQATLFSLLASGKPEIESNKTTVSIPKPNGGFTVDFTTGVLNINAGSFTVVPNVRLAGVTCSGKTALFVLGLTMSVGSFESYKMKGFINELPNMWEEDPNYGVTVKGDMNDPSVVIPHYSYHKFDVVTKNMGAGISVFPWVTIATPKKKVDMADVKAALDEEGVITGDKYLLKFFAGKQSANAALIGDGGAYIYTWHDAGKASKLWNRPMQSRKFLKADQYANNNFTTSCRVPSKIGTMLSDGTVVRQSGRMMVVGLSTSGLAMGSGPCILNPNVEFHLGVKKTLGGRVSLHDYSHHAVSQLTKAGVKTGLFKAHHAFNFLKSKVAEKVEALLDTGKVYAPGETILEINTLPGTKVIIKNTLANVNVRVVAHDVFSAPVEDGDYTPTYFNVDLTVEVIESTQLVKIRRDFIKATTVPMEHKFYQLDGTEFYPQFAGKDMEIMFNNETIKGRSIHTDAFANSNDGYCLNHPNDANMTWHYDDKVETVNLLDKTNLVSDWVEECVEDVILEINVAQDEWDKLMEAGSLTGIVSVVQHDGYVTVKEKIQLLVCQLPIEVEISTAAESIGASPMTPEMVCGISVQSQKLAAILFEEAKSAQATVLGLVNMITKTVPMTEANAVNLTSAKGREFILSAIGTLDGMDDSHVLKAYKALFGQGVYFVATNGSSTANMFLDFDVIRTSMVWISGSADQISQEIVAFLRAIVNPPESGYDTFFYGKVTQLMASLNGWLKKAFVSKGILKRAARSSKCLVNLKIRTCYYEFLQSDADGLPKAAINPGCDSVMLLAKDAIGKYYKKYIEQVVVDNTFSSVVDAAFGIVEGINPDDYKPNKYCRLTRMKELENGGFVLSFFNPYLLDGELVAAFRIPMFMGLGCKLVVIEKVGRSHLFMLPYLWSMANEGDSDGDGVSVLNLGIRGMTISDVNEMNDSWVGLKGYKIIYGDNVSNWPYAEFSESPKKKWMKWDTAEDKAKFCKPYVSCIPKYSTVDAEGNEVMGYYESGVNVQKHYVAAVGIAYGIASVLTFKLADALYNPEVSAYNIKAMKLAVVIAWRALYEGLGLAGYSDAATKWFAILGASKLSGTYVEKDGQYFYPGHKAVTKNDSILDAASTLLYLGETEEEGKGLSKFWLGKDKADGSNDYYNLMYKAMKLILEAEATRTFYSGLEKGSNVVKVIRTEKQLKECYMFGGLRRMGQGFDPAGIDMLEAGDQVDIDDEVILPQSLFAGVAQTEAYNGLSNPYLKSLLINGTSIHNNISSYLYDEMKADEEEANNQPD